VGHLAGSGGRVLGCFSYCASVESGDIKNNTDERGDIKNNTDERGDIKNNSQKISLGRTYILSYYYALGFL